MTLLDRLSTFNPLLACLLGIVFVGFMDNMHAPQLTFSLFCLIPIGFLSWVGNRTTAIIGTVLAAGLALLGEGNTNMETAETLNIIVRTVEFHRANLAEKLGLHDTAASSRTRSNTRLSLSMLDLKGDLVG
jgi:hypothetical protein